MIGEEGTGFNAAMGFFMHSRPQVAAGAVGIARAAFEYAAAYANEREAFGKPIMRNQGVSFMLADMGMNRDAARALVCKAAATSARGEDVGLVDNTQRTKAAAGTLNE